MVIAIQPNVPMDLVKTPEELRSLTDSHFTASEIALRSLPQDGKPRLVIWPESPMNFTYGTDQVLRARVAKFAAEHRASVLLNSQEAAPNDGLYNSALLINEQGSVVAQYDKIRLLPFGEYVPLPDWLPGAGLITSIVGSFTAGTNFPLMQVGHCTNGRFHLYRVGVSEHPAPVHTRRRRRADQYFQRRLSGANRRHAATPGECSFSRG